MFGAELGEALAPSPFAFAEPGRREHAERVEANGERKRETHVASMIADVNAPIAQKLE